MRPTTVQVIAHQGGAAQWPGNSMRAFEAIAQRAIAGVELDIHVSRDGHLVVLHDAMMQLTDGRKPVSDLTADEISASHADGVGRTLREVLEVLHRTAPAFDIQIDIKTDVYARPYPDVVRKLAALIQDLSVERQAIVASFLPETLSEFHRHLPAVRLRGGLMPFTAEVMGGAFAAIDLYRAAGASILDVNHQMLDRSLIEHIRSRGMTVGVATVNGMDSLLRWMAEPIDRIITDEPDLALALSQARGASTPACPP
jgi:glycerophosphoryl diester phosphodiesterase